MLTYTRGWSSWDRVINIYRPQRSCGKVMFLHLSVILFTGDGSADTPLPPGGHPSSQGDGSCSGGYASYWNPFLSWNSSHDPVTFYVVLTSGSTIENQNEYLFISARQWSCRKVTFSVVSVCLSTEGSLYTEQLWPLPTMYRAHPLDMFKLAQFGPRCTAPRAPMFKLVDYVNGWHSVKFCETT